MGGLGERNGVADRRQQQAHPFHGAQRSQARVERGKRGVSQRPALADRSGQRQRRVGHQVCPQQLRRFLKRKPSGDLVQAVAANHKFTGLAVDVAEHSLGRHDTFQTVRHFSLHRRLFEPPSDRIRLIH